MSTTKTIETARRWLATRKPAHLLDRKGGDAFHALFDDEDVLSDLNVRRCWWNSDPAFYPCDVLATWHPMLFESVPGPDLNRLIRPLFDGFDVERAFLWQSAETRWVYLSRQDPNHDEDAEFIDTRYVQLITIDEGTPSGLSFRSISVS